MIYPTLHFNYNNSGYAVIKLVDTNLPDEKASLFSMMFENDQETITMFMNLLSTFITQDSLLKQKSSMKMVGMMDLTMVY